MNRFATIFLGAAALAAAHSSAASVRSSAPISTSASYGWVVKKGSPGFDRIRTFLLSRLTGDSYTTSNLDAGNLGDFTLHDPFTAPTAWCPRIRPGRC